MLATKHLEGRKPNKAGIILAVCLTENGSDTLLLLVIGKSKCPCCPKNINLDTIGCKYRNNSKAWITQAIFNEWLKSFDARMAGRQVLLIMDNCSAHIPLAQLPTVIRLRNTTVFYLLPITTSKLHPCDAGIIRNLKAYYRRRFNRLLLQRLEQNVEDPERIDVLQAIRMAVADWNSDVKAETISNCFLHCKIRSVSLETPEITAQQLVDNEVIEDLQLQIRQLRYQNPMDIRVLFNYPAEEEVAYTPDEDDIIAEHLRSDQVEEQEDDTEELPRVMSSQALDATQTLEYFWLQQPDLNQDFLISLQQMKDKIGKIRTNRLVQKPILEFFSKAH